MYTSHYDHFGIREAKAGEATGTDRIFNGALDNASGVAGVLEIAQAIARAPVRPTRSIYVVFTTAEESGLLGAEYFASHLPLPAANWAANINVDVLNVSGPSRDIVLLGSDRSSLGATAARLAAARGRVVGPDAHPEHGSFFRSDHFPLAKAGIPAVSIGQPIQYIGKDAAYAQKLYDEYNERHYHQPSDEFSTSWDFTGAVEDLRFLTELGWRIAAEPRMPAYHAGDQFARPRLNR